MAVTGITDRGGVRGEESELVVGAADAAGGIAEAAALLLQPMRLLERLRRLW